MRLKIGEQLLRDGLVTSEQLEAALNHQKTKGGRLGRAMVALGYVKDEDIVSVLSRRYGVPTVTLDAASIDPAAVKIIPAETARRYRVLPLSVSGTLLTLAMADPTNVFAMDDIRFVTGYRIEPVLAAESALVEAIERHYGSAPLPAPRAVRASQEPPGLTLDDLASVGLSEIDLDALSDVEPAPEAVEEVDGEIDLGGLGRSADSDPVVKLTNVIVVDALKRGATDIHVEPYEKEFRVRFRIDGILYNVMALPMKLRDPLTSRIKIMARLDIAEKRLPQGGIIRIKMRVEDRSRDLDFRVSCLPTLWGEKIVLRLLDKSKLILDMTKLGFEPDPLKRFQAAIARPHGLVVVAGPTHSGKTNTLLSAMAVLNRPSLNVVAVQDRVEYSLPGINHVSLRPHVGLTAVAALHSVQRQDPNVILVDEIRDDETAEASVKFAARAGQIMLAGRNDTDTAAAVEGLARASGRAFLLGHALNLVVAQRLARRVCESCKVEVTATTSTAQFAHVGFTSEALGTFPLYAGKGCGSCNNTGYRGRVGLFEVLEISDDIRDLAQIGATAAEIRRKGREEGMTTLRMSGLEKIRQGITTVEEVLRETSD